MEAVLSPYTLYLLGKSRVVVPVFTKYVEEERSSSRRAAAPVVSFGEKSWLSATGFSW